MKNRYLKFASVAIICQLLFFGSSLKAEAISATIVADIPSLLKWAKDFMVQVAWTSAKKGAIQGTMLGVQNAIGGGTGESRFITDWRDALQIQPERATRAQLKNFFTTVGKGRQGNYVSADGTTSYAGNMLGVAEQSVMDMSLPQILNLADYGVNDPAKVLNQKNLRAFMTAYGSSGGIGNAAEATLIAQDAKARYEEINNRLAEAQAIANGGYYPTMANGMVITPGSSIRDLMASAQNTSFVALATATTIQEVTSALVSRTVSSALKQGIGQAKKAVKDTTGINAETAVKVANDAYGAYNEGVRSSFGNLNAR